MGVVVVVVAVVVVVGVDWSGVDWSGRACFVIMYKIVCVLGDGFQKRLLVVTSELERERRCPAIGNLIQSRV